MASKLWTLFGLMALTFSAMELGVSLTQHYWLGIVCYSIATVLWVVGFVIRWWK